MIQMGLACLDITLKILGEALSMVTWRSRPASKLRSTAILKNLYTGEEYCLSDRVVIGRALDCDIPLTSDQDGRVSKRHAEIRASSQYPDRWEICDLGSKNGTYVNGERLEGCWLLQPGDRLSFGGVGAPEFHLLHFSTAHRNTPFLSQGLANLFLSFTTLFGSGFSTLVGGASSQTKWKSFAKDGYGIKVLLTLVFGLWALCAFVLEQEEVTVRTVLPLVLYLLIVAVDGLMRLCDKQRPWQFKSWKVLFFVVVTTIILTWVVKQISSAALVCAPANNFALSIKLGHCLGATALKELLKALPLLAVYFWGLRLSSQQQERLSITEPLDGIRLGILSGAAFLPLVLYSTMVEHPTRVMLSLMITLGGEISYGGIMGYFIGLSALKLRKRFLLLIWGYFLTVLLHFGIDVANFAPTLGLIPLGQILPKLLQSLSYIALMLAIPKAKDLAQQRQQALELTLYSTNQHN